VLAKLTGTDGCSSRHLRSPRVTTVVLNRAMAPNKARIRDAEAEGYKGQAQGALRAALDAYLNADAAETLGGSGPGSSGAASFLSPSNANPAARFGSATLANRQTAFENLLNIWIGVDAIPATALSGGLSLRQATILEQVYGTGYQIAKWVRLSTAEFTCRGN
jgi:hypothetical protein